MNKIKSLLALLAVLVCGGAWAAAPVAVWDGFTEGNLSCNCFSWTKSTNTSIAGGVLTIGNDGGLTMVPQNNTTMKTSKTFTIIMDVEDIPSGTVSLIDITQNGKHVSLICKDDDSTSKLQQRWENDDVDTYGSMSSFDRSVGHRIAVTYWGNNNSSTGGTTTFIDGVQKMHAGSLRTNNDSFTLLNIGAYNNNASQIASGMKIKKLALFDSKLTAADVSGYKFPSDVGGDSNQLLKPRVWNTLDGNFDQSGSQSVSWGDTGATYETSPSGQAIYVGTTGKYPYYSNMNWDSASAFTVVGSFKVDAPTTQASPSGLCGIGWNTTGIMLAASQHKVSIVKAGNDITGNSVESSALDIDLTIGYHSYALVYDGSNVSAYLDGEKVINETAMTISLQNQWGGNNNRQKQGGILSLPGGVMSGTARNTATRCDDYRVYGVALNQEQLIKVALEQNVAVAKIGEKKYVTLKSALAAAQSGQTVTLLTNTSESVTISENVTVEATPTAKITGAISGSGTYSIALAAENGEADINTWFSANQLTNFSGKILMTKGRFNFRDAHVALVPSGVTLATSNKGKIYLAGGEWNNSFILAGSGWTGDADYKMGPVALRIDSGSFGEDATIEVVVEDNVVPAIGVYNTSPTLCAISGTGGLRLRADSARTITISGANLSGLSGEINLFDANVTLAIDVADGESVTIGNVISGSGKLKKTGAGTLQLTSKNSFTGGMTIDAGTVKGGATNNWDNNGAGPFGKNTGTITIGANGTLDFNDNPVQGGYTIVSNGGTINKTGTSGDATYQYIKSLTLNANTSMNATKVLGIGVANNVQSTLTLGASTLNVSVSSAQGDSTHNFFLRNTQVTGTGTINLTEGNLLLYGAGSTADNATITLGADATIEAQQNLTVKNLNWCGGTVSVSSGKAVTVKGAFTATIDADKAFPKVTLANTATSITKAGSGKLTMTADNIKNFTGSIVIQGGSIDLGAARPSQNSISFAEGTTLYLKSNAADEGVATIPHITGTPTVYMNGTLVEGATVTDGVLKVPYDIVVSGEVCLYDWTFTNTLASVGINKNSLNWDSGYSANNGYLTDADKFVHGTALNTKATPYVPDGWNVSYPAEWTCMIAGIMPAIDNGPLIVFGTQGGGSLALISTGATEVKLVRTSGNSAYTDIGDPMEVPNARTASHAYTFVKTPTSITIYLDGKFWSSTPVNNPTFGTKLQVGSIHGGKGDTNIESSKNATNATSIQAVRIMEGAAGEKTAKKFADEFPYVSPSGVYTRTFTAGANQLWNDESNKWDSSKKATEPDGVAVPVQGIVKATFQGATTVKMNVESTYSYETLTIDGTGPVTFTKGDAERQIKSAETIIKTAITLGENSIDLTGGQTKIEEGGSLTFDFTALTAAGIASNYPFSQRVTGVIDEDPNVGTESAKIKVKKSDSLDPRVSLNLVYDSVGKFYKVEASVTAGEVYATSNAFDTFVLSNGTTPTGLFPGDTIVIKNGIYTSNQWQVPFNVESMTGHRIVLDYDGGMSIYSELPSNMHVAICQGRNVFLQGNQTFNSGVVVEPYSETSKGTLTVREALTINGNVQISCNLVVETTTDVYGTHTGIIKLSEGATLVVPQELPAERIESLVESKFVDFNPETKTYSLVDPAASITIEGVTTKYATLAKALAAAAGATAESPITIVMMKNVTTGANIPANVVVVSSSGAKLTGALTGTGTIKLEQAATSSQGHLSDFFSAGALTSFQGTVWLAKGRFRHASALEAQVKVKVSDGAQLYMAGGTWQNKISLSGNGYGDETAHIGASALRFEGDTVFDAENAQITIEDEIATICVNNAQKTIACKIVAENGARLYTRYGVDSITLTGDLSEVSSITKLGDEGGALVVPETYAGPISLRVGTIKSASGSLNVSTTKPNCFVSVTVADGVYTYTPVEVTGSDPLPLDNIKPGESVTPAQDAKPIWEDTEPVEGEGGKYITVVDGALVVKSGAPVNGLDSFKSYVLGLDPDDATSKPYLSGADTTSATTLKLVPAGVTIKDGYTVTPKLRVGTTPTSFADDPTLLSEGGFTITLPTEENDKVKYYQIEYTITK